MKVFCALTILLGLAVLRAQPTQEYSHGDPSDAEQLMLEYVNRSRANPQAEAQLILDSDDPDINNALLQYGIQDSVVISQYSTIEAVPPVAFHPALIAAARGHSRAMIDQDLQAHQVPGELDLRDRTQAEGYDLSFSNSLSENVYAYVRNIFMGHAAFEIDWGGSGPTGIQDPPGHREGIHDIDKLTATEIGIGVLTDDNLLGVNVTGPLVVTQDFGRPSNPVHYALGVAYVDSDNDGFYSEGEGLEGVTITPDQGDWYAVTSSSGGYAIPLISVSGTVTLTASGGELGEDQTESFTYADESVKIDFIGTGSNSGGSDGDGSGGGDGGGDGGSGNGGGSTSTQNPVADFGSDTSAINNYVLTTWFGGFFDLSLSGASPGWIYHDQHGALFYSGDENGMWFYSSSLKWTYTDRSLYPFMYANDIGWLFYYEENTTERVFFDYTANMHFVSDATVNDVLTYF